MAIKLSLEPKNNQLVPINALKQWSQNLEKVQDENVWKKIFDKTSGKPENYRKRVSEINNVIKKLPAPTEDKGSRVWFQSVFLQPFGGKATKEAKEIFEALAKGVTNEASFVELEKATQEYNQALREATTKLAKSAQELNNILMDGFASATNAFAKAYKDKKAAAGGAGGAGGAGVAPSGAPTGAPTAESIDRELYQSKKLLELGFVTENEYLAKLVEIKNILEKSGAVRREFAKHSSVYGKRNVRKSIADAQKAFEEVAKTVTVTKQKWKETLYNMLVHNIINEDAASNSPIDDALAAYGYTPEVIDSLWNDYISKDKRNVARLDPSEAEKQRAAAVVDQVLQNPEVTAAVQQAVATASTDPAAHAAAVAIVRQNLDQATAADSSAKTIADNTVAVINQPERATEEQRDAVPPTAEKIIHAAETPKTNPNIYQNAFDAVVKANLGKKITKLQWKQQIWTMLKTPPPVSESLKYDLSYSKKLLRFGFITESEYLASLVRTKSLLQELATSSGTATVAPPDKNAIDGELTALGIKPDDLKKAWTTILSNEENKTHIDPKDLEKTEDVRPPAADPIDAAIKTLIGDETNPQGEIIKLATLASGMQDQMTRFAQGIVSEALSYKEKQLAKLYVKKQVLSEYARTGNIPTKTQLNEFFIASILLAALAAALAWAASKLTAMFKDSYPSDRYGGSSGRSNTSDSKQTLTDMAAGLGGGLDVGGNFVDGSGNKVIPVAESITKIKQDMQNIQTALNKAMEDIKNSANYKAGVTSESMAATLTPATQQYAAVLNSQEKFYSALAEFSKEAGRK